MIETWGFREDIKDIDADANDVNDVNNKEGNDDKGISALGLDRDLEFYRGPLHIGGPVAATEHSFLLQNKSKTITNWNAKYTRK